MLAQVNDRRRFLAALVHHESDAAHGNNLAEKFSDANSKRFNRQDAKARRKSSHNYIGKTVLPISMTELKHKFSGKKVILGVAACLLFGGLLAVGFSKFIYNREQSSRLACMNHLIQIEGAKQQWKLEHKKTDADVPTWNDIKPYIVGNVELKCPVGGIYNIGKVGEYPACSITNHSLQ